MFFATNSIFIGIATMLYVFRISKSKDKDGNEIVPVVDFRGFIRCVLLYFQCDGTDLCRLYPVIPSRSNVVSFRDLRRLLRSSGMVQGMSRYESYTILYSISCRFRVLHVCASEAGVAILDPCPRVSWE